MFGLSLLLEDGRPLSVAPPYRYAPLSDDAETPALISSLFCRQHSWENSRQLFDELSKRWFPPRAFRSVEEAVPEKYEWQT
jgi:hypothetical protein